MSEEEKVYFLLHYSNIQSINNASIALMTHDQPISLISMYKYQFRTSNSGMPQLTIVSFTG